MRKFILSKVCVLLLPLFIGCTGTANFYKKPNFNLNASDSTITVVGPEYDKFGIRGRIENLLMFKGFEVVSDAVISDTIVYQDTIHNTNKSSNATATLKRVNEVKSKYVLKFNYTWAPDALSDGIFTNFSGKTKTPLTYS